MARTRAERRANTRRHQARNRSLVETVLCSNQITPSGERCACSLCITSKRLNDVYQARPTRDNTVTDYELD